MIHLSYCFILVSEKSEKIYCIVYSTLTYFNTHTHTHAHAILIRNFCCRIRKKTTAPAGTDAVTGDRNLIKNLN